MIQFKVLVLTDGVAVHHDCGITETTIKELFTIGVDGALHPDLVAAAMTSIQYMADKYNGAKHAEAQTDSAEANSEAGTQADLFCGTAQGGQTNEENGQVDPAKAV